MASWLDPIGATFGAADSVWDSFFGNPADDALDMYSYEDMLAMLEQYYGQYRDAGSNMLPTMEAEANKLISSPSSVYSMLGADFQTSPGYEYQMQTGMNASNQAAAAGGMAGTQQHQAYSQQTAQGIAAQEWNTYMKQMTDLYMQGLGLGGDITQMGYNASSAMAQDLSRFMGAQMGLEYAGSAQQQGNLWGSIGAVAGMF